MDEGAEPAIAAGDEARHRPLTDDLRALAGDALAYAAAEAELQKARATYAAGKVKWLAVLGLLAVFLLFFSLVALTVGLVIALTPLLGALIATLAVFAGLLLVAAICGLLAAWQWKRLVAALSNRDAE
jgi:hypothetical protein